VLASLIQAAARRPSRWTLLFRHLGAFGLFALAILDSSPLPTLGGPDILIVILVATRSHPWYEFALVATAGSVIGAYLTFRLARKAGRAYLESKFRNRRLQRLLNGFERYGTGALVASTAIPFPFPTSVFFAAAGASKDYSTRKFLSIVAIGRGFRYSMVALIAHVYGRHVVRVLRHPRQYWGWFLAFAAIIALIAALGVLFNKQMERDDSPGRPQPGTPLDAHGD
jgi:membrane protein YqaA with SNARE-associated domain